MKKYFIAAIIAAAFLVNMGGPARAAGDWKFEFAPYIWGVGMDGSVEAGGHEADINMDFGDIIDHMKLSAEVMAVAQYKQYVGFVQLDYLKLAEDEFSNAAAQAHIDEVTLQSTILTVAAGYQFPFSKNSWIDVMAGGRFLFMDTEIDLWEGDTVKRSSTIADALLVLRPNFLLTKKLRFNPTFSIGAGDSDITYELQPQFQYNFTENIGLRVGYRLLHYKYETDGDAKIDIDFSGPMVGASFKF